MVSIANHDQTTTLDLGSCRNRALRSPSPVNEQSPSSSFSVYGLANSRFQACTTPKSLTSAEQRRPNQINAVQRGGSQGQCMLRVSATCTFENTLHLPVDRLPLSPPTFLSFYCRFSDLASGICVIDLLCVLELALPGHYE